METSESKVYKEVLEHRKKCPKWNNKFCLDCFGGGLTRFGDKLLEESIEEYWMFKK